MAVTDERASSAPSRLRRHWPSLTPRTSAVVLGVITLAAFADYTARALLEQARYLTTGYDLGIFDQAVRAYSHFRAPMVPLKGSGYNIFGDHFHPIIAVLAPLYWIWDSPDTLIIAQAALTAAAIPVVYRFTRRRASAAWSLVAAATFAVGWPILALIDFDFHEVAFATPLAALAIDALDRRDDRRLILWTALLLLVREDMGVIVALLGVLRLTKRPPNRRLVIGLVAAGAVAYGITTQVIIPHFAAGHGFVYANQFGQLGPSISSALLNIVTKPWHAIAVFFSPATKAQTLALLLLPLCLLPLRSPYALLALPLLAERFFNSRTNLWGTVFHYNALPWVILFLAMVDGAGRFGLFESNRGAVIGRRALATVLVATPLLLIIWPVHKIVPITQLRPEYAHAPATWQHDAAALVAHVPASVCVAADNHIVPHLTRRDWTTVAEVNTPDPDFYAIDMTARDTGGNPPAPKPIDVLSMALSQGYQPVFVSGSFVLLQSAHYAGPSAACAPLGPGKPAR